MTPIHITQGECPNANIQLVLCNGNIRSGHVLDVVTFRFRRDLGPQAAGKTTDMKFDTRLPTCNPKNRNKTSNLLSTSKCSHLLKVSYRPVFKSYSCKSRGINTAYIGVLGSFITQTCLSSVALSARQPGIRSVSSRNMYRMTRAYKGIDSLEEGWVVFKACEVLG